MAKDENNQQKYIFAGFDNPNTTPIPDTLFDELMTRVSDAELRVLLYIMRRTYGFKKDRDSISLKQMVEGIVTKDGKVLDGGTGLSKSAVARGLKGLIEKGIIVHQRNSSPEKGNLPTTYALRDRGKPLSSTETGGVSPKETRGVSVVGQALVLQRDTQETVKQETDIQNSNSNSTCPIESHQTTTHRVTAVSSSIDPPVDAFERDEVAAPGRRIRPKSSRVRTLSTSRQRRRQTDSPQKLSSLLHPHQHALQDRLAYPAEVDAVDEEDGKLEYLASYVADYGAALGDEAPKSSVTWAIRTWRRSGMDIESFLELLRAAKADTQEHSPNIQKKRADNGSSLWERKNKFAYFKACVEQRCGLREERAL